MSIDRRPAVKVGCVEVSVDISLPTLRNNRGIKYPRGHERTCWNHPLATNRTGLTLQPLQRCSVKGTHLEHVKAELLGKHSWNLSRRAASSTLGRSWSAGLPERIRWARSTSAAPKGMRTVM